MMGRGVPAGAIRPYQDEAYMGMPSSAKVGTSGSAGLRFLDATAKALSLPPAIRGRQVVVSSINEIWPAIRRSEEHTSELQSLMRISYAVFCLKKKKQQIHTLDQ